MATRQRLSAASTDGSVGVVHAAIGLAMAALLAVVQPREGDPLPFKNMAERFAAGQVAYRDYPIEYPPLSLLPIYMPRLLGGPSEFAYELIFSLMSIALALATAVCVYWLARRGWSAEVPSDSLLVFVGLSLAAAPLVVWRFDILPALLSAVALAAYAAQHNTWAGAFLGFGTAAKLYPAFLGPVFFLARVMERRWRAAAWLVIGAALTGGALALQVYSVAGMNAFSYLLYQEERGIEIESVAGGLVLLADAVNAIGARIYFGFGSWQVTSSFLGTLQLPLRVLDLVLIGTLVSGAVWTFWRDVRDTGVVKARSVVAYLVATLLFVMLTNKVLSPQYLVWLLPFAALLPRRQALLFMAIVVITVMIYPFNFSRLLAIEAPVVFALNVRNALLLALYAWVVWPPGLRLAKSARRA